MPSFQHGSNASSPSSSIGLRAGAGLVVLALHAAVVGAIFMAPPEAPKLEQPETIMVSVIEAPVAQVAKAEEPAPEAPQPVVEPPPEPQAEPEPETKPDPEPEPEPEPVVEKPPMPAPAEAQTQAQAAAQAGSAQAGTKPDTPPAQPTGAPEAARPRKARSRGRRPTSRSWCPASSTWAPSPPPTIPWRRAACVRKAGWWCWWKSTTRAWS